jgi:hypothetical protein
MQRKQDQSSSFECPPVFIVAEMGQTVMFSHVGPLLLPDTKDGNIVPFPADTDEEQAGFVLSHIRVGRA